MKRDASTAFDLAHAASIDRVGPGAFHVFGLANGHTAVYDHATAGERSSRQDIVFKSTPPEWPVGTIGAPAAPRAVWRVPPSGRGSQQEGSSLRTIGGFRLEYLKLIGNYFLHALQQRWPWLLTASNCCDAVSFNQDADATVNTGC